MIIIILLFSQIACEWVEISQNHYRKEPMHKVHLPNVEYTTKNNRVYINNSTIEKQWHRGVIDKVSNVGNIRRVQNPSVKTSAVTRKHEDIRFNKNFNDHPDTTQTEYNLVSGKPNIKKFLNEDDDLDNLYKVTEQTFWTDIDHVKNPNSKIIKKIPTSTNAFDPAGKLNFHNVSFDDYEKKYNLTEESSKIKLFQKGSNYYHRDDVYSKQSSTNEEYSEANYKIHETSTHPIEEYLTNRNKVITDHRDKSDYDVKNSKETIIRVNKANDDKLAFNRMENAPSLDDEETFPKIEDFESKGVNLTKGNSMKGMWKLVKLVTDTIYKNTHRSFKSKINYLESLKATILANIEDQIERAWPDDAQLQGSRRARSAQAQSRGHVEFPSSESALMTISFLTFAVFVIKLVLQVIHTYKNKAMMVTPTIVAAVGRAAAALRDKAQNF